MGGGRLDVARPLARPTKPLAEVAAHVDAVSVQGDAVVIGIAVSSARVEPGDLFVALGGLRSHGAIHVAAAVAAGARAVLTDPEGAATLAPGTPAIVVPDPRAILGDLSAWLYDYPARDLATIGITGTQGKTSTTFLVDAALRSVHSGVIGSMGARIDGAPVPSALTTPEAPQLQALLARMREDGVRVVASEVSSHAVAMRRTEGMCFDVGVFLNLGHDHRDFHGTQQHYREMKRAVLTPALSRHALVNIDDATGRRFAADPDLRALTFSVEGRDAHWSAVDVAATGRGSAFTVIGPDGARAGFRVQQPGLFSVSNALAAVAALATVGVPLEEMVEGIAAFGGVEGRVQFVPVDGPFDVVIDAAHKPEAVNGLLRALRAHTTGRIITVIGSNGDRDAHKRPLMGRLAATASDIVVVTDDNPASEDPAAIRRAVVAGTAGSAARVYDVAGRAAAIHHAVGLARAGDMLVIVGKGDERHQITAEGIVAHSDPDEVAIALAGRLDLVTGSA